MTLGEYYHAISVVFMNDSDIVQAIRDSLDLHPQRPPGSGAGWGLAETTAPAADAAEAAEPSRGHF